MVPVTYELVIEPALAPAIPPTEEKPVGVIETFVRPRFSTVPLDPTPKNSPAWDKLVEIVRLLMVYPFPLSVPVKTDPFGQTP
jgi:hypothetical protein